MLWFPEAPNVAGFAVTLVISIEESVAEEESVFEDIKSSGSGNLVKTISTLSVKVKTDVTVFTKSYSTNGWPICTAEGSLVYVLESVAASVFTVYVTSPICDIEKLAT